MTASQDRFIALDGIRGVAAAGVLLFHCGLQAHAPWLVGHGALAVDVFFVMSGIVVERAYGPRLRSGWPALSFARARLRRLYPLYAVGLALGAGLRVAVLLAQGGPVPAGPLAAAVAMGAMLMPLLPGGAEQVFPLNGPSWSLFVEAATNAGFAIAPRRIGRLCLVMVVLLGATIVAMAASAGLPLMLGGRAPLLWLDLARGAYGFGLGVWMSRAAHRGWVGAVPRLPTPLVLAGLVVVLAVPRGPLDLWFDPIAILVLSPILVALAAASRPSPSVGRFCLRAGALSYPLYVVHAPLLDAAERLTAGHAAPAQGLALLAAALASLVLAAALARRTFSAAAASIGRIQGAAGATVLTSARATG